MALTTLAGLRTALAAWTTYDDLTDAQLDEFIYWAHQEVCRRMRCNLLLASSTATVNAETIAVPSNFLAIKRFYLNTTPRAELRTTSPEEAMDYSGRMETTTYPEKVAVEGSSFRFAPLFTGSITGTLLFYQKPTLMTLSTDTNVVLTAYPYVYLFGALEALYSFKEDDNNADRYGQKFGALISDINGQEAKDVMAGPLQVSPYLGGVV